MKFKKEIQINDGTNGTTSYYYWDSISDEDENKAWSEALEKAKSKKEELKKKEKIRWFIIKKQEGVIFPIFICRIYFDKEL